MREGEQIRYSDLFAFKSPEENHEGCDRQQCDWCGASSCAHCGGGSAFVDLLDGGDFRWLCWGCRIGF